jgi:hypothetical protein
MSPWILTGCAGQLQSREPLLELLFTSFWERGASSDLLLAKCLKEGSNVILTPAIHIVSAVLALLTFVTKYSRRDARRNSM